MRWVESIIIDRPKSVVYPAVVDQNVLMQWSAWPEATGFTCRVEEAGASRTTVSLEFEVDPPVPALLRPIAALWLSRSIRPLHVRDLELLKSHVERGGERPSHGE